MRAPAAAAMVLFVVLAGCSYGYVGPPGPPATDRPTVTPRGTPASTTPPGGSTVPSGGSATASPVPATTPAADPGRIEVVGASLPVDATLVYDRTRRLVGRDATGPERVDVWNLSTVTAGVGSREPRPFFRLMGLTNDVRANDTDVGVAAFVANPDVVNVDERLVDDPTRLEHTLAHEYTHVVQFRTGAVTAARLATDATLDGRTAWRAAVEGAATYVEDAYWRRYVRTGTRPKATVVGLYRTASGGGRFAVAPYRFGYAYVAARVEGPGDLAVVYRDPPRTTEQVLHPGVTEAPASLAARGRDAGDWWAVPGERRMGELFVRVVLSTEVNASLAARGADGWGTDRRLDFLGPNGARGYAWVLRWDDAENATEFERVLDAWLADRATRAKRRWRDGGDAFRVVRAGERTVVLYAGDPWFVRHANASWDDGTLVVESTG